MSSALSHKMDAAMDAYHAKKNYEATANAYENVLLIINTLNALAKNALTDEDINRIDDLLSDVKHIFGKAAETAWEEAR